VTRALVALAALALVVAAPAAASEAHPTLAEIEAEVMCPTCHTLLEVSHAPIAERMRAFVKRRIAAGDRKSQIEDRLVAQFGEAVLASPPKRGFSLTAWVAPVGALLVAAVLLAWRARRSSRGDGDGDVALDAETELLVARALAPAEPPGRGP